MLARAFGHLERHVPPIAPTMAMLFTDVVIGVTVAAVSAITYRMAKARDIVYR